jgi:hypothetical protein
MVTFPSSVARYAGREFILPASAISSQIKTSRMKYWEVIADKLSKAGWSWGWVSAVDSNGRTMWIVDAHRDDGKRFISRADDKLTAFLELARMISTHLLTKDSEHP